VAALFCCLLLALGLIDAEHYLLPDRITLPGIVVGLAVQPWIDWGGLLQAAIGAALGGGLLLALWGLWLLVRKEEGMGLGDVKMLAMVGAFLGWKGVLVTLFFASLVGSAVGLGLIVAGRGGMKSRLPFGVFLALAAASRCSGGGRWSTPTWGCCERAAGHRGAAERPGRAATRPAPRGGVLLPTCLILLVALSTYTLFSYRAAVDRLVEERRGEALRTARGLAAEVATGSGSPGTTALAQLKRRTIGVERIVLVAADGALLATTDALDTPPLAPWPVAATAVDPFTAARAGVAVGPGDERPAMVSGFAPLMVGGERRLLRVDLAAETLAARRREVAVLTPVVVGIDIAVGLLVLFFLRHLMAPYEALLAHARQLEGDTPADEDEVEFLVRTYQHGLAALARTRAEGADEDIAALERMLGGSLESGLLLLDHQGRVLALNPVGERLLEVPSPEPGAPLAEALAARPALAALLAEAVARSELVQRREIDLAADGSGPRRVVGLSIHPLKQTPDGARGFLVLFADLTDVRRQADEARLADGLLRLGELAAGVAHELRNGLATLRGYLALAERSPPEAASFLAEMRREADHLQRVLEDFLSFARPGSVRLEEIRAGVLLARAAADPALAGAAVHVEDGGLGETLLRGDPQLLERALRNLLHNACQAQAAQLESDGARRSPGGSRAARADSTEVAPVAARLRRADGGLELLIEDRGPGVPSELGDRLFDPFVSARPGGTGLGLALAHRIIDLHGGSLRLEEREGGGTRAVVWLPA
jgi:signal transduction histidine kinase/Flp pilus assembly protein protease CpaA